MLVRDKIDYNKKIVHNLILITGMDIILLFTAFCMGLFKELNIDSVMDIVIMTCLLLGGGISFIYLWSIPTCFSIVVIYQIVKFIKLLINRQPLSNMIPNKDSWIILRDFTLLIGDQEYYKRCK